MLLKDHISNTILLFLFHKCRLRTTQKIINSWTNSTLTLLKHQHHVSSSILAVLCSIVFYREQILTWAVFNRRGITMQLHFWQVPFEPDGVFHPQVGWIPWCCHKYLKLDTRIFLIHSFMTTLSCSPFPFNHPVGQIHFFHLKTTFFNLNPVTHLLEQSKTSCKHRRSSWTFH